MAVNITTDTNTVKVTSTSTNKVIVVDNTNNTSVSVSQPTTRVIKVATVGPQGAAGVVSSTGSFATTGSNTFIGNQVITGSLTVSGSSTFTNIGPAIFSGSVGSTQGFTGSLQGTASYALNTGVIIDTGSFATTGSNSFTGNQIITGSLSIVLPGDTANGLNENPTPSNVFWSYTLTDTNTENVQVGWTAQVEGGGTYTVTNVEVDVPYVPFIAITLSEPSLSLGYRSRVDFSRSTKLWKFNPDGTLTGLPENIVSSSTQISNLGFISQSADLTSLNAFTSSYNTGSFTGSFTGNLIGTSSYTLETLSASFALTASYALNAGVTIDTGSFSTTGSNTFIGNQTIEGSLTIATPSAGIPDSLSNWNGQGGWNQGFYSNLATTGGTGTGLTVDVAAGGEGYISIEVITINTPGSGYTDGDVITIDNENNLPGTFTIGIATGNSWLFDTSGSLTTPGDINVSGSLFISGATELGGNIVPKTARGATLGTPERPFREIYVSSGSISIASDIPGDPSTTLSNSGGNILVSAGGMRLVGDASFIAATGSFGYISGSMTQVGDYTQTGNYTIVGDKTITGSLDVTGVITTPSEIQASKFTFEDGIVQVNSLGQKVFATDTGTLYQYSGENGIMIMNQEVTQTLATLSNSGDLTVSGSISSSGTPVVTSTNVASIQTITSASYAGLTPVSGTLYIIIG